MNPTISFSFDTLQRAIFQIFTIYSIYQHDPQPLRRICKKIGEQEGINENTLYMYAKPLIKLVDACLASRLSASEIATLRRLVQAKLIVDAKALIEEAEILNNMYPDEETEDSVISSSTADLESRKELRLSLREHWKNLREYIIATAKSRRDLLTWMSIEHVSTTCSEQEIFQVVDEIYREEGKPEV
jgi:hypothetical protein